MSESPPSHSPGALPAGLPAGLNESSLGAFAEGLQEEALPAVWSRGVSLSRTSVPLYEGSRPGGEFRFRLPLSDRPVHPFITLWLEDGDWHCDCGDRNDPCLHIVATVMALKSGRCQQPAAGVQGAVKSSSRRVDYRLTTLPTGIRLERFLQTGETLQPLGRESLVGRIAGIQSGRIAEAPITATQTDLQIDQALSQAQALPEQGPLSHLAQGLATARLFDGTIASVGPELDGDLLTVPPGPGLGVEIDESALDRFRL